ncbi:MAG TPA: hypothetical protein VM597_29480 [Gemmataceae bacterium]|jgi:hypothetical protein|nr:hypothetical protein [Gemmataceae bacterium]
MYSLTFVVVVAVVPAAPLPPAKAGRDLTEVDKKLYGTWTGTGPCQGNLVLRADGTYDRTGVGPGGHASAGTWTLRKDAGTPTLVLKCKEADNPADVREVAVRIVRLDDVSLSVTDPDSPGSKKPRTYSREKK